MEILLSGVETAHSDNCEEQCLGLACISTPTIIKVDSREQPHNQVAMICQPQEGTRNVSSALFGLSDGRKQLGGISTAPVNRFTTLGRLLRHDLT
ncbi:hypothetical protein SNOG_09386 [Parastagonospora nodorum SN15]|uniref:Uncharacterized protein n=1 Tax=Phaeosphaeria nodorum (strain SN15 / ATCC MYA-4574 / FGSC 10173) TaxID=321614 RepID=Q0UFS8_PHANO|nr:hypothetical protein SNOG_09386 [Parastagonospora nodorum SN15]EAT83578.1 hypothetical protein SNOG_09386 [Parastagonospora nodorum SN15]